MIIKYLYILTQPFSLLLLWHILFDYDIFSFIVSYVGQINLFLIGLVVFLSSIYVTIFTICKVTKYMSSKIFYLLNCMNLIFSYFMSNKFYEVASLGVVTSKSNGSYIVDNILCISNFDAYYLQ